MLFRNEILYIDNAIGLGYNKYNGQKYVYRKNLQGDIVAILDECGCTRGTYEYDAWGNIIWQGGSELLTINPFRYRGYYYDTETGLYYLNSRYYDPETGRFISPDRIRYLNPLANDGLNLYIYCGNNPSNIFYACEHEGELNAAIRSIKYIEATTQTGSKINIVNAISSTFEVFDQWYGFFSSAPDAFLNFFGPDGVGIKSLKKYVNGLKCFGTGILVVGAIFSWGESVYSNFSNPNYSTAEAIASSVLDAGYFSVKGVLTYSAGNLIGKAAIACGTAVGGAAIAYLGASFGVALAIGSGVAIIVGLAGAVLIYVLSSIADGVWNDFKEFIFG